MDGPLHQDGGPNPTGMPNGQFMPNGAMIPGYNGIPPPPNYYNGPLMQHRPDMPSTSNGPLPPLQFPQQPQGFHPPMEAPNGGFYPGGPMPSQPGMMPNYNGGPPLQYFNGPQQMNGLPTTPSVNGFPPDYQQMPHRVPSTPGAQARASPFVQPPMNGPMTPTYVMPGQAKTPGMFMPMAGRSTPNGSIGFVFTTDMANQAASEVSQSKQPNIAQWHSQHFGPGAITNATGGRKSVGARNSPSYTATTAASRKRKGSQAQERQNPTPSPQLQHQPGSVPEFKQPMSNHAPGSVPDSSQFGMDQHKQFKMEQQIKIEPNSTEQDPLKKLELMARQNDNSVASKLSEQLNDPKQPVDSKSKLARLDLLRKKLITDEPQQPQFPPQMYGNVPPQMRFMPNGGMIPSTGPYPMPPNGQPQMYYNTPNGMAPGAPMPMYHNGPPTSSMEMPNQMPQNGHPQIPPGYMMQRFPPPGMMQTPNGMIGPNGLRMPYPPMDMNMPRPNCPPEMFNQWHDSMPQPLANLDSRVPSQKINYYGNGAQSMPPTSNTPNQSLKNGS